MKVNGLVLVKARSITNEFYKRNEGELKIMKQLESKTSFKMKIDINRTSTSGCYNAISKTMGFDLYKHIPKRERCEIRGYN